MATRKLVSRKGTLLGTITFPDHWMERWQSSSLRGESVWMFAIIPPMTLRSYTDMSADLQVSFKQGGLSRAFSYQYPDALELHGVTLEEFEQVPGCSFAPGAGYLRSLLDGA